ncbi:MAG: DUF456 domain-containing protein [Bacteroidetes bacterium]|nr:DUF456 domain-containing protein [Bacteroidota bacterium]
MDAILIILGIVAILAGLAGSVLPVLPGPPLAYISLILLQFTSFKPFSVKFLVLWGGVTVAVTILDYVVPVYGTKVFGGTSKGMWGATIGLIIGIFFLPPFGMIVGPFLGALVGEMLAGAQSDKALKAAFGSFLGFLAGTLMKLALCIIFAIFFIGSFF